MSQVVLLVGPTLTDVYTHGHDISITRISAAVQF